MHKNVFLANNDFVLFPKQRRYMASEHLGNHLMDHFFKNIFTVLFGDWQPQFSFTFIEKHDKDALQKNWHDGK